MVCVFCRIVAGEVPAEVVLDEPGLVNEPGLLGFLDHRPLFPGHVLIVPKAHHETLLDLPAALSGPLLDATRRVAAAVQAALEAEGFFVAMNNKVSQSVPHLHMHVIPRRKKDGLKGFFWPRVGYRDAAHMAEVGAAIRAAMR